jgi:hypothetical protein
MACGVLLRGGLITAIYSRALSLSSRARVNMSNGRLVNHISTDVSRIDFCMNWFHMAWTAPIQLIICLILLLINLGPSALAGFALFVIATPINIVGVKHLFSIRIKSMAWTDKRSKLLQEMLGGMRVIKFFSWEIPFLKRISEYRQLEMAYVYIHSLCILTCAQPNLQLYTLASHFPSSAECICHFSSRTGFRARIRDLLLNWPSTRCCNHLLFSHTVPTHQDAPHVPSYVIFMVSSRSN